MGKFEFIDSYGSFRLENPQSVSYLYFPVAGENGIKSSLTPRLGGDAKKDQNTFLLEPVSSENLHNNGSTRNFWCRFSNGGAWSATGASAAAIACEAEEKEACELIAGLMWHTLCRSSVKYGLSSEITSFVPVDAVNTEVMLVTIKNIGSEAVSFLPMTAIPMYGRSADNIRDHRHVTSLLHRGKVQEYGVSLTPTLTFDERGHKRNEITYYAYACDAQGKAPMGAIPVTEDFIGEGGSFLHPGAVYGTMPELAKPGSEVAGYEMTGALVFAECTLKPGEECSFVLCMGTDTDKETTQILKRMAKDTLADWKNTFAKTKEYWREQVNVSFHTGEEQFDQYMKWIAFQPMLRRIYGCSFLPHHDYGKGGRGWRDLWQDCLALLIMNPGGVRRMLLDNFGGVRLDGSNATIIGSKQGEFIADRNNITRVWMDHGFWPLHTTNFYIHQTGDVEILLEKAGYFKDRQILRGEGKDEQWTPEYGTRQRSDDGNLWEGTLLEHILIQNLTAFYDVGEHNRIRLRGADWNDALDMAVEHGESVAFTFAYAGNLATLQKLLQELKRRGVENVTITKSLMPLLNAEAELYTDVAKKQALLREYCTSVAHECSTEHVELSVDCLCERLHAMEEWLKQELRDGEWLAGEPGFFNGYYDNHSRRVECSNMAQLRMMLTSQVFAVQSGTATKEQTKEIIEAADRYLYRKELGGYCLNTDFKEVKDDLGRMFGFAYGHKENGAVFSHMAVMYGNALYLQGFAEAGYRALHTLYQQAADFDVSKIYPGIPEYFNDRGRGMYHYLTGAASWYMMTVLTEMFGVRGEYGNLIFAPKLLKEQYDDQGKAGVCLVFADRRLQIIYEQSEQLAENACEICVHGKVIAGKQIAREELLSWNEDETHEITVRIPVVK